MKILNSIESPATKPQTQPHPSPAIRPEPVAPGLSIALRDSLGEAERAEEIARQTREREALRQPVGLD